MHIGMTRGYRRDVIQKLQTFEKGKKFYLEVLLKLVTLGYQISEIPVVLEWKDKKLAQVGAASRKSSSEIHKLIFSYLNFAVFANPIRYFWTITLCCGIAGLWFIASAFYRLFIGKVAIYFALVEFSLLIAGLLFFGFGILTNQNNYILRELWRLPVMQSKKQNENK